MDEQDLISIGEAASIMDVSIDTLRRWDKSGKLKSTKSPGGHRLYSKLQIELYLTDLFGMARDWVLKKVEIPSRFYCPNSAVFQARLTTMQDLLAQAKGLEIIFPLIVAVAGEIGNNSFDHNLGNWPDIPGVFFGYDLKKGKIVLADRGQGVLTTLARVKPELQTDEQASRAAFTEIISGRAPERRGNGLKFVRQVISENPIALWFQTGEAELELRKDSGALEIRKSASPFRGCAAMVIF